MTPKRMTPYLTFVVEIIIIYVALRIMDFNQTMGGMWIAPYLSAALNFDWSTLSLWVSPEEVKLFASLDKESMFNYHFTSTISLSSYDYLSKGLVFFIVLAKKIFFWMGDLEALQYLQYSVHILISLFFISLFQKKYQKVLFFILYAVNPLVLWVANHPFYYFWQVIPSAIFLYWYFKRNISLVLLLLFSIVFALVYITRPTVLFLILFFYILYAIKTNLRDSLMGIMLFGLLINLAPSLSKGPWHTAYIGVGAYENSYHIKLDDRDGYKLYYQKSGKIIDSNSIMDKKNKEAYYGVLKEEVLQMIEETPLLFMRNALYNTIQAYGVGYSYHLYQKFGNSIVYAEILLALTVILLLLYTKQYILFLAIGLSSGSFTLYYPPILTYMFGNIILIVVAIIGTVDFFVEKRRSVNVSSNG